MEIPEARSKKIFTEKQIMLAAFLGGPVPIGILFFKNFVRVGKEKLAYMTLATSIIFTLLLFTSMFLQPESVLSRIPSFLFAAFYSGIVYLLYRTYLTKEVIQAFVEGAIRGSNWAVAGVTSLGLVLTLVLFFGLDLFLPTSEFTGDYLRFDKNRIYYNKQDDTESKLQLVSTRLYDMGYFDYQSLGEVKFEKSDDHFLLTIPFNSDYWESEEEMELVMITSQLLGFEFGQPVKIVLYDYTLSGGKITKIFDP